MICLDNFYSGSKENVWHLIGKPNFELVLHDVINPYWAEGDEGLDNIIEYFRTKV